MRYAEELGVPQHLLEQLPDLSFHTPSPGQVILVGNHVAGGGTALRTSTHGLVVLTNRHVAAEFTREDGPVFAFWPEPDREVDSYTGQAYTAARVRTLIPNDRTLAKQRELEARLESANPEEATSQEELRQTMRTLARGLELRLVQPDLALLQVVEGPASLDELSAAPLARREPSDVQVVLIYPERGTLSVKLARDAGTLRAAPTSGGEAVSTGPNSYTTLGMQVGNSGTGLFNLNDELCGLLSGYLDVQGPGQAPPQAADPREETPSLLAVIHDPDVELKTLNAAAEKLLKLWKPH